MNQESRKKRNSLKSRIRNYRIKSEQVHKTLKSYNRQQEKQIVKEILKILPDTDPKSR